ncbi:MAG: 30S ribosomal protein S9 [Candidatus Cloacimonetes bacterium]|nr:30S ribosomal protein S9 [Candidatus Cloacimonadota bacterium]
MAEKTITKEKPKKSKKVVKTTEAVWISGRRKTAVARIKLAKGKGTFTVNDQAPEDYFPTKLEQEKLFTPFQAVGRNKLGFDVSIKVSGGGKNGQLEACVHGLSRALEKFDPVLRPTLKKKRLLTRDPRMRERKKYGLKRARKAPQYSKR